MNFRVLKAFLAVSRTGNITRAAEQLHMSQSALSRRIAELEDEVGSPLFDRTGRCLTLTDRGMRFEAHAREMLEAYDRMKRDMSEAPEALTGMIRLGCVESSVVEFACDVVSRMYEEHPKVTFELYSADGDDIRAGLDQDRLDLGILLEPVESAKYEAISLPYADRWGIVVPKDSPEAKLEAVRVSHLTELSLLLPRRWILLDVVASWLGVEREKLQVRMVQNLATNSFEFVRRGFGAMLCVEGAYRIRPTEDVVFVPLTPERRATHKLVRRRNRRLGEACEVFWMRAKEMLQNAGEETA